MAAHTPFPGDSDAYRNAAPCNSSGPRPRKDHRFQDENGNGNDVGLIVLFGDYDAFVTRSWMRGPHVVKFYQFLGGGLEDAGWQREYMPRNCFAILPGPTH